MRIALALLGIGLTLSTLTGSADSSKPQLRPELVRLLKNDRYRSDDYEFPYLFCQTAIAVSRDFKTVESALLALLLKDKIAAETPLGPHPGVPAWNKSLLVLPKEILSEKERIGLDKCTLEYCFPKLNDRSEKPQLMKAKDKAETFRHLISNRVENFLKTRTLVGYEGRNNNHDDSVALLNAAPFLKSDYPDIFQYLQNGFWKNLPPPIPKPSSFLRTRTLVVDRKRLEPVYWIGEVIVFREKTRMLAVEFPIYSNHYFDSWIRIYETVSLPIAAGAETAKTGVILTDLIEFDELKKSAVIRMLFKGRMVEGVQKVQQEELDPLD